MTVNERVRELRKKLGLNQKDFGKRCGIAQGHLTNLETGRREVTEKTIKVICLEYGVNENWLRTGRGEIFVADKSDIDRLSIKYNLSATGRAVLEIYLQFDEAHRKIFDEALEAIASGILAAADHHKKEALLGPLSSSRHAPLASNRSLLAAAGGDTDGLQAVVDDFESADIDI